MNHNKVQKVDIESKARAILTYCMTMALHRDPATERVLRTNEDIQAIVCLSYPELLLQSNKRHDPLHPSSNKAGNERMAPLNPSKEVDSYTST
ncbi:predicted protein [Histoplasma mississippiense (nom. inval.)]|uniref:predicted protein n=1 Tax=Ajellomyces capsulatus (strain NAm1 / WU24) TaxID=2059318 RepID=UPI000157BB4A|nr:predicted protein [Histoplasma mississippiense (nom. inval.)]EDN05591.1 predicted protein [Histoplasma mississippiense (nom. inval.)]